MPIKMLRIDLFALHEHCLTGASLERTLTVGSHSLGRINELRHSDLYPNSTGVFLDCGVTGDSV